MCLHCTPIMHVKVLLVVQQSLMKEAIADRSSAGQGTAPLLLPGNPPWPGIQPGGGSSWYPQGGWETSPRISTGAFWSQGGVSCLDAFGGVCYSGRKQQLTHAAPNQIHVQHMSAPLWVPDHCTWIWDWGTRSLHIPSYLQHTLIG